MGYGNLGNQREALPPLAWSHVGEGQWVPLQGKSRGIPVETVACAGTAGDAKSVAKAQWSQRKDVAWLGLSSHSVQGFLCIPSPPPLSGLGTFLRRRMEEERESQQLSGCRGTTRKSDAEMELNLWKKEREITDSLNMFLANKRSPEGLRSLIDKSGKGVTDEL